jgi:hypothetical protein
MKDRGHGSSGRALVQQMPAPKFKPKVLFFERLRNENNERRW